MSDPKPLHNIVLTNAASWRAGGLFYSVRRLHQEIARLGPTVSVYAPNDHHEEKGRDNWSPLPLHWQKGLHPLSHEDLRSPESTIVHVHGIWRLGAAHAMRQARQASIPQIISPRGMLDDWALRNAKWKKKIAGWLYENRNLRQAACIHALCEAELQAVRAYGLTNPVCVIPNGVDLPDGIDVTKSSSPVKRLVFLGRIHPKKGLRELIDAWGVIAKGSGFEVRSSGWKLVVAGWDDGGFLHDLERQVAELELSDTVEFAGSKYGDDKDAFLRGADAFILPSFSEGLPMAVLEAWAYGLPVVMTPMCNLAEGFTAGAALSIEPNPESIAQGLKTLMQLPDQERIDMGQRGRRLVANQFTWPAIARQMMEVYEWILGRRERPETVVI